MFDEFKKTNKCFGNVTFKNWGKTLGYFRGSGEDRPQRALLLFRALIT